MEYFSKCFCISWYNHPVVLDLKCNIQYTQFLQSFTNRHSDEMMLQVSTIFSLIVYQTIMLTESSDMWLVRSFGVNTIFHGLIFMVICMKQPPPIPTFRQLDNFVNKLQKKFQKNTRSDKKYKSLAVLAPLQCIGS